jgi:hypothetical protein
MALGLLILLVRTIETDIFLKDRVADIELFSMKKQTQAQAH